MSGVLRIGVLAAGLVAAGLALRLLPHGADAAALDRFVAGRGLAGEAVFVLAAAAGCAVGLPRQVAAFAAGYAFGAASGTCWALGAQILGCAAAFGWARAWGRAPGRGPTARRMPARVRRVHDLVVARPFMATLTLRLLPVGNNLLLNLLAGVSGVAAAPFLAASLLGYVPQTIVFALLGGGTQLGQRAQLAVGAGLFALSAAFGAVLLRRGRAYDV